MSNNTLNAAMRRMGFDTQAEHTAHGFRVSASTLLNEKGGFPPDAIERQLAHAEGNKVRAAYHRAEYLEERRRMMNWWADYIEQLKTGGKIILLHQEAVNEYVALRAEANSTVPFQH